MPSQADRWYADAEQAVLNAMINLPVFKKPLNSKTVISSAMDHLLETAGSALDETQAYKEIRAAVKRLDERGDIAAPQHGTWRRLRF
jgi:hypothetical protein